MGDIHVVVGGQFGSEGKGHVTGWLAKGPLKSIARSVVRVAGPNAGHTAYDDKGRPFALRQIPVAAVTNPDLGLVIGAGSEIDPDVLEAEIDLLEQAGITVRDRLYVDNEATVISQEHKDAEGALVGRIGSTGKGIGAARAARIRREAQTWQDYSPGRDWAGRLVRLDTSAFLRTELRKGDVLIEGTQGYGLGLRAGFYPFCTSSDCRAIDFLAMAGLLPSPAHQAIVWPVFRTFPIRVAGNSGPLANETSWADLSKRSGGHIKSERTTVTQKVRRVGEWDPVLARAAIEGNGGDTAKLYPVLLFLDYMFPELASRSHPDFLERAHWQYIEKIEEDLGHNIAAVGTGPDSLFEL